MMMIVDDDRDDNNDEDDGDDNDDGVDGIFFYFIDIHTQFFSSFIYIFSIFCCCLF